MTGTGTPVPVFIWTARAGELQVTPQEVDTGSVPRAWGAPGRKEEEE